MQKEGEPRVIGLFGNARFSAAECSGFGSVSCGMGRSPDEGQEWKKVAYESRELRSTARFRDCEETVGASWKEGSRCSV